MGQIKQDLFGAKTSPLRHHADSLGYVLQETSFPTSGLRASNKRRFRESISKAPAAQPLPIHTNPQHLQASHPPSCTRHSLQKTLPLRSTLKYTPSPSPSTQPRPPLSTHTSPTILTMHLPLLLTTLLAPTFTLTLALPLPRPQPQPEPDCWSASELAEMQAETGMYSGAVPC